MLSCGVQLVDAGTKTEPGFELSVYAPRLEGANLIISGDRLLKQGCYDLAQALPSCSHGLSRLPRYLGVAAGLTHHRHCLPEFPLQPAPHHCISTQPSPGSAHNLTDVESPTSICR